jgi:hypothetical protein
MWTRDDATSCLTSLLFSSCLKAQEIKTVSVPITSGRQARDCVKTHHWRVADLLQVVDCDRLSTMSESG